MNRKQRRAQGKEPRLRPDRDAQHLAALYAQGFALHQQGRLEDAQARYEEMLRLRPDLFDPHKNLVALLIALGRPGDAAPHLAAAHRMRPNDPDLLSELGNMLKRNGQEEAAIARYREALRADPAHYVANRNLGVVLHERGEFELALARYEAALQARPNDADVQHNILNVRRLMCDWSSYERDE